MYNYNLTIGGKMKLKVITLLTSAVLTGSLHAEETYSIEAGFEFVHEKSDSPSTIRDKVLGGAYYFKPVAIKDSQPFTELEFLQRSSNATFTYSNMDVETDGIEPTTLKPVSLGGTFYLDDFVLSVGYSNTSSTRLTYSSSKQSWDVKSTNPSFGVGYFVLPTTLVSISNSQNVVSYASVAGSTSIKDSTTTKTGLTAHTVMPLSGTDSIVGEIYLQKISYDDGTKTQNNNDFGIDVKYFPAMNYYVGGGFVNNSGDRASTKGTTFKLAAGYQFTPRLGLLFETSKFKVSDDAQKTSSTSSQLEVVYRF